MRQPDVPPLRILRRATTAGLSLDTRFRWYFWLMEIPVLAEAYTSARGRVRHKRLQGSTRLVVDGFGSSANTFFREAFLLANPHLSDDDICSNMHSSRVVRRAAWRGLPCIVLVRDPRDAVASLVQRFPGIRLRSALTCYAHYYARLVDYREAVVVAPFPWVTRDFSAVVRSCNDRFGTDFRTGHDHVDLTSQAFARIEALASAAARRHR